jgi:hypothetical protein
MAAVRAFLLLFAAAVLVASPAHAQRLDGSASKPPTYRDREQWREHPRTPERRPGPKSTRRLDGTPSLIAVPPLEREREDWREHRGAPAPAPAGKAGKSSDVTRPLLSVRPMPDNGPPSPAVQMQQRMEQERRNQRGGPTASQARQFRCTAFPACERASGSYGSCRGVEEFYAAHSRREAQRQIARDCAAVNTPDPCNCAAQCRRVAQCGPV